MSGFLFLRPAWLLLLPLVAVLAWRLARRPPARATPWRKAVDAPLLAVLLQQPETGAGRRRVLLWGLAWGLAVVILAGPSWQRLPPLQFQPQAPPLALLLDLADGTPADRLEASRAALDALLEALPARPVSLWVFSGRAWRVMPASEDLRLLRRLVERLAPDLLPLGGRNLAAALQQVAASQPEGGGELVVITASVDAAAQESARRLAAAGWRVHVLGPREEQGLAALAHAGGGRFHTLSGVQALARSLAPETLGAAPGGREAVPVDGGPWLIPLLLVPLFLGFRRGAALLGVLLAVPLPPAEAAFFLNRDQQAWELLRQGRAEAAAEGFTRPLWQGIAYYRAGDYRRAAERFARVESALGRYNLGNARVRLGDLEGARQAYREALARDPALEDARYNLRLVERALAASPASGAPPGAARPAPAPPKAAASAQALLEPLEGQPASGRKHVRHQVQASQGGGMILAPDSAAPDPGGESGQTGQMQKEGAGERQASEAGARQGARAAASAGESAEKSLPGTQPRQETPQRPSPPAAGQPGGKGVSPAEAEQPGEPGEGRAPAEGRARGEAAREGASGEEQLRAMEVWLESIQDDPAELLRALFRQQLEEGGP